MITLTIIFYLYYYYFFITYYSALYHYFFFIIHHYLTVHFYLNVTVNMSKQDFEISSALLN